MRPPLRTRTRQGNRCTCSLLCGVPDAKSHVFGGELCAHVSYQQRVRLKALATCPLFPPSDKISRIATKFRFPFHVCYSPCLSCFFPILRIRGSPQFKNGNETWLLGLYPLLASNHGNATHTLHHGFSPRIHTARRCPQSAPLQPR